MGLLELCAKQTDEALAAGAGGDVHYDPQSRTFDCAPSLTDSQVLDFCRTGVIVLSATGGATVDPERIDLDIDAGDTTSYSLQIQTPDAVSTHSWTVLADVTWNGSHLGRVAEGIVHW